MACRDAALSPSVCRGQTCWHNLQRAAAWQRLLGQLAEAGHVMQVSAPGTDYVPDAPTLRQSTKQRTEDAELMRLYSEQASEPFCSAAATLAAFVQVGA